MLCRNIILQLSCVKVLPFIMQVYVSLMCLYVPWLCLQGPGPDSRIVYIDGSFDLFHAGHVEVCHSLMACYVHMDSLDIHYPLVWSFEVITDELLLLRAFLLSS